MFIMNYDNMGKIFYKNPSEYKEIYEKRYNADNTYRYDFLLGNNPAFVVMSNAVWDLIYSIDNLDKKLQYLLMLGFVPGVAINQFIITCLIDEVKLTNEIEGVHSTRKEIQSVLTDIDSLPKKVKENKEYRLKGLVSKYLLLLQSEKALKLESLQDVRKLYDEFVAPEIGASKGELPDGELFRSSGAEVLSKGGRVIHRGVFPEQKIEESMKQALNILNDRDKYNPLVNIAVFHYLFGYTHPFYDGNGRMSRFISSAYLGRHLTKIIGLGLSYTIKENITTYYSMFKDTNHPNNKGDVTAFVLEFLLFIKVTLSRILKILEDKLAKLDFYTEKLELLTEAAFSDKEECIVYILLQATLFAEDKSMTIKEVYEAFIDSEQQKVSESNIRQIIKQLPQDLVQEEKRGRSFYYSINLSTLDEL